MSKGGTKTATTTTEIPEPYRKFAEGQLATAATLQNRPYVSYQSPLIADFTQRQQQGIDQLAGFQPAGDYGASVAQDLAGYQGGQIAGSDLSAYNNPYEDMVVSRSLADIDRARQMAQQGINDQAVAAGAFGGSRAGVQAALTNEAYAKQSADTAAQLRQAGFSNAQQLRQQDIANQMAAAQMRQGAAGQLGAAQQAQDAARMGQINALLQAGAAEQGMTQSNLDLAYRQFLEEQNYPLAQLALGQSILGQTPMGSTTRAPIRTGGFNLGSLLAGAGTLATGLGPGGLGLFGAAAAGAGGGGFINTFGQSVN